MMIGSICEKQLNVPQFCGSDHRFPVKIQYAELFGKMNLSFYLFVFTLLFIR